MQGQGQGQGLDLQGQGQQQGLDSQGPGPRQGLHLQLYLLQVAAKPTIAINQQQWTQSESSQHMAVQEAQLMLTTCATRLAVSRGLEVNKHGTILGPLRLFAKHVTGTTRHKSV